MSRWTYAIPLACLALGALLSLVLARAGLHTQIEKMARLEVPGERTVDLKPGQHLVFLESTAPPNDIHCSLHSPSAHQIPLTPARNPERYQHADQQGKAAFAFETFEPGPHRFQCEARSHKAHATTVAIGRGLGSSFPLAFIPAGVGLLLALLSFLIISSKRRHS